MSFSHLSPEALDPAPPPSQSETAQEPLLTRPARIKQAPLEPPLTHVLHSLITIPINPGMSSVPWSLRSTEFLSRLEANMVPISAVLETILPRSQQETQIERGGDTQGFIQLPTSLVHFCISIFVRIALGQPNARC